MFWMEMLQILSASKIGQTQFEMFVFERIQCNTKSISDTIKKNNFLLFRCKNYIVPNKSKQKIVSFQAECCLYANLYLASQSRGEDLDFFIYENHLYSPSISEYGKL